MIYGIFQLYHLIPVLTAYENVDFVMLLQGREKGARAKAIELLERVGLGGRHHHYPSQLSGGEQQRVAVCRALMNKPSVILADEPSGNLDSASAQNLHKLFFELRKKYKQTFVIVTHNQELANMADRKLKMRDGRIIA